MNTFPEPAIKQIYQYYDQSETAKLKAKIAQLEKENTQLQAQLDNAVNNWLYHIGASIVKLCKICQNRKPYRNTLYRDGIFSLCYNCDELVCGDCLSYGDNDEDHCSDLRCEYCGDFWCRDCSPPIYYCEQKHYFCANCLDEIKSQCTICHTKLK